MSEISNTSQEVLGFSSAYLIYRVQHPYALGPLRKIRELRMVTHAYYPSLSGSETEGWQV